MFFIIFGPFSLYKSRFSLFNPINPLRFTVHYRSKPFRPPQRTAGAPRRCPTSDMTVSAQEQRPTVPESRETSFEMQGQLTFLFPIWPSYRSSGPSLARPYLVALPAAHPRPIGAVIVIFQLVPNRTVTCLRPSPMSHGRTANHLGRLS